MNQYNPAIHHRRSIRLKGYDYSQAGLYFITLCCHDRRPLFGRIHDGVMVLSPWGKFVEQEWLRTPELRPNVALHEYVIMPNHFHAILEIKYRVAGKGETETATGKGEGRGEDVSKGELQFAPTPTTLIPTFKSPSQTVGAIIRGFKAAVTTHIRKGEDGKGGDDSKGEDGNGRDDSKGEDGNGRDDSKGELQFAPTAPTTTTLAPSTQKIWQRDYYEHVIRDEAAYERIANYIQNNPLNWEKDSLK